LEKLRDSSVQNRSDAAKDWEKIDELFYRALDYTERSFKINLCINLLIVAVGGVLVLYSISYGWLRGPDAYTAWGVLHCQ
jgi:hypothetical protein